MTALSPQSEQGTGAQDQDSPWGSLGQYPVVDTTRDHGVTYQQLVQKNEQGGKSMPTTTPQDLEDMGYWKCPGKLPSGAPCDFWLNPQQKYYIEHSNGYFTCPRCHHSYDLMEDLPFHGMEDIPESFNAGGATRVGIPLSDQGQIGENIVAEMGEIPGYGRITWWHPGGATANSPLDGATDEWGIEVKTIGYDSIHHRFSPGGGHNDGRTPQQYKQEKDDAAAEMGLKGVLGVLVLLDYRRDVADIYVKPMPLEPWQYQPGRWTQGVVQFRKNSAEKLVAEVPFQSPYKDPNNPNPVSYNAQDYYESPKPVMPPHLQESESEIPF